MDMQQKPSQPPPSYGATTRAPRAHTNAVIEAGKLRSRDEVGPKICFHGHISSRHLSMTIVESSKKCNFIYKSYN